MPARKTLATETQIREKLTVIEKADRLLIKAITLEDTREVLDVAKAAEAWGQARHAPQVVRDAIILQLKAQRKAGQFLIEMKKRGDILPHKRPRESKAVTMTGLGLQETEAKRWQRLARIPEDRWETYLNFAVKRTQKLFLDLEHELRIKAERLSRAEAGATTPLPFGVQLIPGDFRNADIADDSVDLIITDPPYSEEWISLWSDLGAFAARVLKPGSMLVTYTPQEFLPRILDDLRAHLTYYWIGGIIHGGGKARLWKKGISVRWKPILFFVKGPDARDHAPFDDIVQGVGVDTEKRMHEWAQGEPEAEYLIAQLAAEGGTVLDPMCGPGTFVYAAYRLGRKAIGIETDSDTIAIARTMFGTGESVLPMSSD